MKTFRPSRHFFISSDSTPTGVAALSVSALVEITIGVSALSEYISYSAALGC